MITYRFNPFETPGHICPRDILEKSKGLYVSQKHIVLT